MKLFLDRLNLLKGTRNVSEFARFLGVNQKSLDNYIKGIRSPSIDFVLTVCSKCSVTTDYLLGLTDNPKGLAKDPMINTPEPDLSKKPVAQTIPIIGMAAAMSYIPGLSEMCDLWAGSDDEIPCVLPNCDGMFALRIQGDSMSPKYMDGDVVAFYKN